MNHALTHSQRTTKQKIKRTPFWMCAPRVPLDAEQALNGGKNASEPFCDFADAERANSPNFAEQARELSLSFFEAKNLFVETSDHC
jgi:hypothetical protein